MKRSILFFYILLFTAQSTFAQKDSVCSLPCANRNFTILAHEFLDSTFTPIISLARLQAIVQSVNRAFAPICVSFTICEKRDIRNYNFNNWYKDSMEAEALSLYGEEKFINVFLVENIVDPGGAEGYATFGGINTSDSKVVMKKSAQAGVWIHELGHYFGLYHPFETRFGPEFSNGSNCATTGDLICDTPADPYSQGAFANSICEFQFAGRDPNGDYYLPDVENYMSYYGSCACRFTPQQYVRMYDTYMIAPKTHW